MKKKIALLLAAVMTVAAPMTAFAKPHLSGTQSTNDVPVNTLFTPYYSGLETSKQSPLPSDANNPVDAVGPAKDVEIQLNKGDKVTDGAEFTLNVSNALIKYYSGNVVVNGTNYGSSYDASKWTILLGAEFESEIGTNSSVLRSYTKGMTTVAGTTSQVVEVSKVGAIALNDPIISKDLTKITVVKADASDITIVDGQRYKDEAMLVQEDKGQWFDSENDGTVMINLSLSDYETTRPAEAGDVSDAKISFSTISATGNIAYDVSVLNGVDGDANYVALNSSFDDKNKFTITSDITLEITGISNGTNSSSLSGEITYGNFASTKANAAVVGRLGAATLVATSIDGDDKTLISFNVPVQTTAAGDVKFTAASQSTGFSPRLEGDAKVATVVASGGNTTLTATVARESRTQFNITSLTISEASRNVIQANGSAFKLTLSDGAVFDDALITAFVNTSGVSPATITHVGFSKDLKTAYFTIAGTMPTSNLNKIIFNNILVKYDIAAGKTPEQKQNVEVTVETIAPSSYRTIYYAVGTLSDSPLVEVRLPVIVTDAGITTRTVKVGEFRDYGVYFGFTSSTGKIVTPYSGEANVIVPNITLLENTADSWNSHRTTRFSLTDEEGNVLDGVKINSIQFYARNNVTWPASASLFEADSQIGVTEHYTFNRSFFEIKDLVSQNANYGSELEIKLSLNVSGNYVGPVYLTVDGNAVVDETEWDQNPLQIAEVAAPIEIETKTTEVSIGFQTYDTADVKVTEADKNILKANGTVTLSIAEFAESTNYYSLANNVTFNPIKLDDVKVEAVAKNKQATVFNKVSVNNNSVSLNVSKTSTEATTFTVSGLKVNINRSVPYGNFDLVVGGTSFIKTYYGNIVTTTTVTSDAIERSANFAVAGVVSEDYIRVITKSVYKSMEMNILLTEDNQIALVETKEIDMGIAPYINDAGRMMIPLRALSSLFNIDKDNIIWDEATSTVTIVLGDRIVSFTKDSSIMKVNGVDVPMQDDKGTTVAEIHPVYERFFIPVKPLSTAFDVAVRWDAATKTAYLNPTPAQLVDVFGLTVDSTGTVVN